jgi:hypothetical protein
VSKAYLQSLVETAYRIGYEDRVQQEGYNIAALQITTPSGEIVRSRLLDPRVHKRPKHTPKSKLLELAEREVKGGRSNG